MRVLVVAYGDGRAASTLFRFGASAKYWGELGHELEILPAADLQGDFRRLAGDYDAIVNQKALLSCREIRRWKSAGRPVFFDFDDAIWTRPRRPYSWWTQRRVDFRIRGWMTSVRGVLAANRYLADFAVRFNPSVQVVPMALDLEMWRPRPKASDVVWIGWAGSPGNLWHLEKLGDALQRVLQSHKAARLAVFSGRRPDFDFPFKFVQFEPGAEVDFVSGLDIGLLPLQLEAYSMGKSPIKALQYMSCGVPVVGNAGGATAELLTSENGIVVGAESEWVAALERLITDAESRERMGSAGRRRVEERHDLRKVTQELAGYLAKTVQSDTPPRLG